jgi:hypothetical protein
MRGSVTKESKLSIISVAGMQRISTYRDSFRTFIPLRKRFPALQFFPKNGSASRTLAQEKVHITENVHKGLAFQFRQGLAAEATFPLGSALAEEKSPGLPEKTQRVTRRVNEMAQPTPANIKGRSEVEIRAGLHHGIRRRITV